jgi:hypothetical protein
MVDASDRIRKRVQQAFAQEAQNNAFAPYYTGTTTTQNLTPGDYSLVKQSPYACTNACSDSATPGSLFFSPIRYSIAQVTNNSSGVRDLTIGTSSFTIEWWQYLDTPTQTPSTGATILTPYVFGFGNATPSLAVYWSLTGPAYTTYDLRINVGGTVYTIAAAAGTPNVLNRWVHVAIVGVAGNPIRAFINGVLAGNTGAAYNITNSTASFPFFNIGNSTPLSLPNQFGGFINQFRFVIGTQVYTAAFTPPQVLLPIPNTRLFLACPANNPLLDTSGTAQTVTSGPTVVDWQNVAPFLPTP